MSRRTVTILSMILAAITLIADPAGAEKKKKKKGDKKTDPYAEYVWPSPPDDPRIRLVDVISSRADVEGKSRMKKALIGISDSSPYDRLSKPFAVEIDSQGRFFVSDPTLAAVMRFDRDGRRMDVLGTKGGFRLAKPMGLGMGPDDILYVADASLKRVMTYDPEGDLGKVYGRSGELKHPTDVAIDREGTMIFVADAQAHRIVVFDAEEGGRLYEFGQHGPGEGEFNYPTSIAMTEDGSLLVVDQANARVQLLTTEGEFLDQLGSRGSGYGQFTRPKDVAVDEFGFIYVTDYAFGNVQLFDVDFQLLTFIGSGGTGPGQFAGASGVAARGDQFAIVDQAGRRLQIFRYLESRGGE